MSNGVLCFANNNGKVDYIKQAVFLAKRVKQYLGIPTSIVTTTPQFIDTTHKTIFDKIITIDIDYYNTKKYSDGAFYHQKLEFKNVGRHKSYYLSPYDNTIVMDTDYVLCNDSLKNVFNMTGDFLIYKDAVDLSFWRNYKEFDVINDKGIPFYWATVFFFRKSQENKIFFDLMEHLIKYWDHYSKVYDLSSRSFRNDHLFSIAIHMMNGFKDGDWAKQLPGTMYYTLDQDILKDIKNNKMEFLVSKKDRKGEYTVIATENSNVHVMNKFSFERIIDA